MDYFKCGHIMTTHGIKGALKVKNLSDFDRFKKNNKLFILHNDEYIEVIVLDVKKDPKGYLLVTFKDLCDINLVLKYHGDDIYISKDDRSENELNDNEFYFDELLNKDVYNESGELKGKVIEIRPLPKAYYLVVKTKEKNVLVPFIDEFISEVNDNSIIIKEIEGLFWK